MEIIDLTSKEDIIDSNNTVHYNNVPYNVSEFVFPTIFYALQKSLREQEVQLLNVDTSADKGIDVEENCSLKINNDADIVEKTNEEQFCNLHNKNISVVESAEINDNTPAILPDVHVDIENQFTTVDFWCENQTENKISEIDQNVTFTNKSCKQNYKRKANESFDRGDNYSNTTKITKYYYGDKGGNQQYSKVVRSYATYKNNRNYHANNRFYNNDEPSTNYHNENKSNFRIVREQWQWMDNASPDPHFNWTYRQSAPVTIRQINELHAIKRPSILLLKNGNRCNLPTNLLDVRIERQRMYCADLERRLHETQQYIEGATADDLARGRCLLGKLEEARRDVAHMYGDMLREGGGGMMSEQQEFEVMERCDRLDEYERIYGWNEM